MKKYRIVHTPEARERMREAFRYIAADSPLHASKWLHALKVAVQSLERFPERCGAARETISMGPGLRQTIFGAYRIVFEIDEAKRRVIILDIRHGSRLAAGEEEPHS